MVLKKEQYVCVYREGYDERDIDNYRVIKWSEPEVKRFRTADEMSEWLSDREMDEHTDPSEDSGYRFEIIYSNLEK